MPLSEMLQRVKHLSRHAAVAEMGADFGHGVGMRHLGADRVRRAQIGAALGAVNPDVDVLDPPLKLDAVQHRAQMFRPVEGQHEDGRAAVWSMKIRCIRHACLPDPGSEPTGRPAASKRDGSPAPATPAD
ncbi:hypothetical protein [Brevundimonas sp.]|uniref:hypothetical protein n=1 Tax=Brevundimonas sp. TaxID=1871086 RepID=UPI0025CC646C|nr:hypothetical protein [Brevundimonas sp.]